MFDINRFKLVHDREKILMLMIGFALGIYSVFSEYKKPEAFGTIVQNVLISILIGLALAILEDMTYRHLFKGGVPDKRIRGLISPKAYGIASRKLFWLFMAGLGTALGSSAICWTIAAKVLTI